MTSPDPSPNVASSDRRSSSREASLGRVQVTIPEGTLAGRLENESAQGLFVVLEERLQVQVTLLTSGEERTASAFLTRVATLPGERSGWGLEIVKDDSAA